MKYKLVTPCGDFNADSIHGIFDALPEHKFWWTRRDIYKMFIGPIKTTVDLTR